MEVKVKVLNSAAVLPQQGIKADVGFDVSSVGYGIVPPRGRMVFGIGMAMQPEKGFEIQGRPRSGLALNYGITILNAPATIEPTYTGEIKILLHNTSDFPFEVNIGDRIAQLVFKRYEPEVTFKVVDELDETERGSGGFGSTGIGAGVAN